MSMNDDDDGMSMSPKRVGPPKVPPVQAGKLEIRALHWGRDAGLAQNGGYIEAYAAGASQPSWRLCIYTITYDDEMEEDVQDIFIKTMALTPEGLLRVTDERARQYLVNLDTRHVQAL